jgi:hypothetical protein
VVDEGALGQFFLQVLQVFSLSNILPTILTHISHTYYQCHIVSATDSVVKRKHVSVSLSLSLSLSFPCPFSLSNLTQLGNSQNIFLFYSTCSSLLFKGPRV